MPEFPLVSRPLSMTNAREEINSILDEEIGLARGIHAVMLRDSRIGYEASNHYYYTANDMKEKILNSKDIPLGKIHTGA